MSDEILTEQKTVTKLKNAGDFIRAEFLIICHDMLTATDHSVSFIRLIDQLYAFSFPFQLARFVLVAQLARSQSVSVSDILEAGVAYKLVMEDPSGQLTELVQWVPPADPAHNWSSHRVSADLSQRMALQQEGVYAFHLFGKTTDSQWEELIAKRLPVRLSPGAPGVYSATFSAGPIIGQHDAGVLVLLPEGQLQGGDHTYNYIGQYSTADGKLRGVLRAQRQRAGVSVFGDLQDFTLNLEGIEKPGGFVLEGRREEDPSIKISIFLTRQTVFPANPAPANQPSAGQSPAS